MPFTKSGSFGWAGGGKAGAIIDLWATTRFGGFPEEGQGPPDGSPPDAGPVISGPTYGSPGGYYITDIEVAQDYYVRAQYGGYTFWGACPVGTLGGETGGGGGGGGGGGDTLEFTVAWNAAGLSTGYVLPGWIPNQYDEIIDIRVVVTTPFDGLIPMLDFGTFTNGSTPTVVGMLNDVGASPFPLWTADIALPNNAGLLFSGQQDLSWGAALAGLGFTKGPPVPSPQLIWAESEQFIVVVSQDGTANTPLAATVTAHHYPGGGGSPGTYPIMVTTGVNDTFTYQGSTATGGGGSGPLEVFTVPPGSYGTLGTPSTPGTLEWALSQALANGGTDPITAHGTWGDNGSGKLTFTALAPGAAGNGDNIGIGPTDITAGIGLDDPTILLNGLGGAPGGTQGEFTIYIEVATPAPPS